MKLSRDFYRIITALTIGFAVIQNYTLAAPLWEPVKDDSNATRAGNAASNKVIFGRLAVMGDKTVMIN
ncbi:MAG TPA: hypothetical protein VEF04_15060, partial [Blastocatellia bacterium]|nr:hypothetical protein [Blastocatellia bacterium]